MKMLEIPCFFRLTNAAPRSFFTEEVVRRCRGRRGAFVLKGAPPPQWPRPVAALPRVPHDGGRRPQPEVDHFLEGFHGFTPHSQPAQRAAPAAPSRPMKMLRMTVMESTTASSVDRLDADRREQAKAHGRAARNHALVGAEDP